MLDNRANKYSKENEYNKILHIQSDLVFWMQERTKINFLILNEYIPNKDWQLAATFIQQWNEYYYHLEYEIPRNFNNCKRLFLSNEGSYHVFRDLSLSEFEYQLGLHEKTIFLLEEISQNISKNDRESLNAELSPKWFRGEDGLGSALRYIKHRYSLVLKSLAELAESPDEPRTSEKIQLKDWLGSEDLANKVVGILIDEKIIDINRKDMPGNKRILPAHIRAIGQYYNLDGKLEIIESICRTNFNYEGNSSNFKGNSSVYVSPAFIQKLPLRTE